MNWNSILGFVAIIALLLPIFFIVLLKLTRYKTFAALLIYYSVVLVHIFLTQGYIAANGVFVRSWGIGNNLIDAPLILFSLTYFSGSSLITRRMKGIVLAVLVFELTVVLLRGFNVPSITIIMAPNLMLILGFCFYFFFRQVRITIMNNKGMGKSLMVASLLFAYGCYSLLYLMFYIFKTPHVADTFLIYFLATSLSSLLMTAGIIMESKRIRKLEEVMIARKELLAIYHDSTPAQTIRGGKSMTMQNLSNP